MYSSDQCVEILSSLFYRHFGVMPSDFSRIPQAGSDRVYWRLCADNASAIGCFGPDAVENSCFVNLASVFFNNGVPVPQIFEISDDSLFYLQEDLGDVSLFSVLGVPETSSLVELTLSSLVKMQKVPVSEWRDLCMADPFGARLVMWDLNYFKYDYLKPSGILFDENLLEDDFEALRSSLLNMPDIFKGFMMRDCQSRNVMLYRSVPTFIDFQGGRLGPCLYDAVSFLWQARAGFSLEFRLKMMQIYAELFCADLDVTGQDMLAFLPDLVLFRTLQVLGAYGFRGLIEHKAHFVLSIPGALANLKEIMELGWIDKYPELKRISEFLIESNDRPAPASDRLTVEIFSFSYKKGYPKDFSGNGGGFVFDCRAMHNPGRYRQYKTATGKDQSVIDFLEERGEVRGFLAAAWALVDPAVERYISRGFTNLQIAFGCTGGQHRSVYCAENTARHIRALFPEASVILTHREHPEI